MYKIVTTYCYLIILLEMRKYTHIIRNEKIYPITLKVTNYCTR